MKEIALVDVPQTMSSREIAELTEKTHGHVLRDIDTLNKIYEKLHLSRIGESFSLRQIPNGAKVRDRYFELTKEQCFDLMTGYNMILRIKVNRRWAELETMYQQQLPVPKNEFEALEMFFNGTKKAIGELKEDVTEIREELAVIKEVITDSPIKSKRDIKGEAEIVEDAEVIKEEPVQTVIATPAVYNQITLDIFLQKRGIEMTKGKRQGLGKHLSTLCRKNNIPGFAEGSVNMYNELWLQSYLAEKGIIPPPEIDETKHIIVQNENDRVSIKGFCKFHELELTPEQRSTFGIWATRLAAKKKVMVGKVPTKWRTANGNIEEGEYNIYPLEILTDTWKDKSVEIMANKK